MCEVHGVKVELTYAIYKIRSTNPWPRNFLVAMVACRF